MATSNAECTERPRDALELFQAMEQGLDEEKLSVYNSDPQEPTSCAVAAVTPAYETDLCESSVGEETESQVADLPGTQMELATEPAAVSNNQPLECEVCSKTFKSKCGLRKHYRKHSGQYPYVCDCGKGFSERRKMREHKCKHTGKGLKKCKFCGFEPRTYRGMKWHEQSHSPNKYTCEECSKVLNSKMSLKQHMKANHEANFTCSICDKPFGLKSRYNAHLKVHTQDKPFKCTTCGYSTKRECDLTRHISFVHEGKRPHICPLCGAGFTTASSLKRHESRKFSCRDEKSEIWSDVD